jgi:hypothetical protein
MRWLIAICILFISASGCKDKNAIPDGFIPRDKMGPVLWDIIQVNHLTNIKVQKDTIPHPDSVNAVFQQQIFLQYKISREAFYNSYAWYKAHPAMMQEMLDSMISRKEVERRQEQGINKGSAVPHPVPNAPALNGTKQPGSFLPAPESRSPLSPIKISPWSKPKK